jgi:hypothetical protein
MKEQFIADYVYAKKQHDSVDAARRAPTAIKMHRRDDASGDARCLRHAQALMTILPRRRHGCARLFYLPMPM